MQNDGEICNLLEYLCYTHLSSKWRQE